MKEDVWLNIRHVISVFAHDLRVPASAYLRQLSYYHIQQCKISCYYVAWLGSGVVSVLDSGAEGPGFKSLSRRCRVTVLGKLFTPIVPLFIQQQNW